MLEQHRWVVDTNLLVSRLLMPRGTAAQAVDKALTTGILLVSEATLQELTDVLSRPKFDRYVSLENRQRFLLLLGGVARVVATPRCFDACRDPKDNMFLDVAFNGQAHMLITGDTDLLTLHPFHGIPIMAPAAFLRL